MPVSRLKITINISSRLGFCSAEKTATRFMFHGEALKEVTLHNFIFCRDFFIFATKKRLFSVFSFSAFVKRLEFLKRWIWWGERQGSGKNSIEFWEDYLMFKSMKWSNFSWSFSGFTCRKHLWILFHEKFKFLRTFARLIFVTIWAYFQVWTF